MSWQLIPVADGSKPQQALVRNLQARSEVGHPVQCALQVLGSGPLAVTKATAGAGKSTDQPPEETRTDVGGCGSLLRRRAVVPISPSLHGGHHETAGPVCGGSPAAWTPLTSEIGERWFEICGLSRCFVEFAPAVATGDHSPQTKRAAAPDSTTQQVSIQYT